MTKILSIITIIVCLTSISWCQDTTFYTFKSEFHLKHDFRDYNYELEHCVVFMPNHSYDLLLPDGIYIFKDSLSKTIRLKGEVANRVKSGKWSYFDSIGRLRIEDVFLNDFDTTLITNYYQTDGKLFRIKESSVKYLRTTHFDSTGISSYYFMDYTDSNNVQMSFDKTGKISYQASSKSGKKHGVYYWTHKDGSLYSRQTYVDGKKEGIWKSSLLEEKGIWCEQEFLNDKLVSITFSSGMKYDIHADEIEIVDYYKSGKMRLKGLVIGGFKIGTWKYYDEQGKIIGRFEHDKFGNITSLSGQLEGIPGI